MKESGAPDAATDGGLRETVASLERTGALMSELGDRARTDDETPAVSSLPAILVRTSREITAVLNSLYRSRAFLEQAAVPRLQRTNEHLREVSNATETATHSMLDGIDRSLHLIDQIGRRLGHGVAPGDAGAAALHADLREEVHRLVMCLQFQDVVAQQIGFATHVLEDTERRMVMIAELFDVAVFAQAEALPDADVEWDVHFDPAATFGSSTERQAMADAIIAARDASSPID
jgi:chemotaxis regulatin CheY-phosphate phosphatase CheZ